MTISLSAVARPSSAPVVAPAAATAASAPAVPAPDVPAPTDSSRATTGATAPITLDHDRFGLPEAPSGVLDDVAAVVHLPTGPDDQPTLAGDLTIEAHGLHLPAPPKRGGLIEKGEVKALHVLQDHRTPEGNAWANEMSKNGALNVLWQSSVGYRKDVGFLRGWAGTAVATAAVGAAFVASSVEKHHFDRDRPWVVDPTITPSVPRSHGSSYPSGHTTVAFTAARVFGAFDPEHSTDYYALATKVGAARVYGGVHFPTDVAAGAALGLAAGEIATRLTPWLAPKHHAAAGAAAPTPPDAATPADAPAAA